MKYINKFANASAYNTYLEGSVDTPNLSQISGESDVKMIQKSEYNTYLTFEAIEDGTFRFDGTTVDGNTNALSYSLDNGETWSEIASNTYTSTILAGNTIMWKGNCIPDEVSTYGGIGKFSSTGKFNASGNVLSLILGDNFTGVYKINYTNIFAQLFNDTMLVNAANLILPLKQLTEKCYISMFKFCASLIAAPKLPATTLANGCYVNMFASCTSLVNPPALPATNLTEACYLYMFENCTSLKVAPTLPATTLAQNCYIYMFTHCISLKTAPKLPATTLTSNCYVGMFNGCTSLTTAPALPATTLAYSCYSNMFSGCTSLITAPALPATTLANNCYSSMFSGCSSLKTSPNILPAMTLVAYCYSSMFQGCTSLTTAPVLPATTLTNYGYSGMFNGCTSLTEITCLLENFDYTTNSMLNNWAGGIPNVGILKKKESSNFGTVIPEGWTTVNV